MKFEIYPSGLLNFFYYSGFILGLKSINNDLNLENYFHQLLISNKLPLNTKWSSCLFASFVKGYYNSSSDFSSKRLVVI
jgi:hypothetical protein